MITARDRSCRITGSAEACEAAHIIPAKEDAWFMNRKMVQYSRDIKSIDSSANQMLLRKDLHFTHDRLKWTMFPHGSNWVYYALDSSDELASQYHQRALRPIEGVRREYLLAAFARAIFPWLNPFLRSGTDKYLMGQEVETDNLAGKMAGELCFEQFLPPGHRGRNASPSKRQSPSKSQSPSKRKRTAITSPRPLQDCPDQPSLSPARKSKRGPSPDNDEHYFPPKRHGFKFRDPAFDGPCTCEVLPPSGSATPSNHTNPVVVALRPCTVCLSDHCLVRADEDRLERIRQEKLAAEREKSDPEGFWEEQLAWAKDPEAREDVDRWLWVRGGELLDKDGEHVDMGFLTQR
ncbi:MAG: hypothetical protein Q9196_006715 [Gyalolechia fulgens]